MAHPWPLTEKPCPNEAIVRRTGLKGLAALKASGLFDQFDKPAAVDKPVLVNIPVNNTSVNTADVNTGAKPDAAADRKAYQREYQRRYRAAARALREGAPPS
jgi:hypothetical protein